jgi:hypothetical protein
MPYLQSLERNPLGWLMPGVAGIAGLLAMASFAAADTGSWASCAPRDLEILSLLEQRAGVDSVPQERIYRGFVTAIQARQAGQEGRLADAMQLYDTIERSVQVTQPITPR